MHVLALHSQINGVDMTNGTHEAAVQLLTDHQRFVRLVVQREIKGPLEPPQSPHSPSYLKGLSPSGYMANRPGYKRSIGGSSSGIGGDSNISSTSPTTHTTSTFLDNEKYVITNTSPVVPQQQQQKYQYSTQQSPTTGQIPKTNGIEGKSAPQPAPRRLTSQSSLGSTGVNGNGTGRPPSQNGNKSEDDETQVKQKNTFFILYFILFFVSIRFSNFIWYESYNSDFYFYYENVAVYVVELSSLSLFYFVCLFIN